MTRRDDVSSSPPPITITGTAGQIVVGGSALAPILSIDPAYVIPQQALAPRILPVLLNSWTNSGQEPTAYWKDQIGMVHVEGSLVCTTNGSDMFALPAGFRPGTAFGFCFFPVAPVNAGAYWIQVAASTGIVKCPQATNGQTIPLNFSFRPD